MNKHLLSIDDLEVDDVDDPVRHRGRDARRAAPLGQEAARPARPHRGQPVLRGLHPHPVVLRDRRQVALRRRHQRLRQGIQRQQGREPARHRAHRRGDGRRRAGDPARRQRRRQAGEPVDRRGGDQRRRRDARAPDAGAARRLHAAAPDGHARGQARRDRRRPDAQPGVPEQRAAADQARRPRDRGGAADADAGRGHRVVQGRRVRDDVRPRRGAARGRRGDDAPRPARADERRLLPERPRVHRRLRAHPRPARRCSSRTPRSATRAR